MLVWYLPSRRCLIFPPPFHSYCVGYCPQSNRQYTGGFCKLNSIQLEAFFSGGWVGGELQSMNNIYNFVLVRCVWFPPPAPFSSLYNIFLPPPHPHPPLYPLFHFFIFRLFIDCLAIWLLCYCLPGLWRWYYKYSVIVGLHLKWPEKNVRIKIRNMTHGLQQELNRWLMGHSVRLIDRAFHEPLDSCGWLFRKKGKEKKERKKKKRGSLCTQSLPARSHLGLSAVSK